MACATAKLPFVIANPVHIKKFAGAIGQLAKTDKHDARLIAHYGAAKLKTFSPHREIGGGFFISETNSTRPPAIELCNASYFSLNDRT